MPEATIRIPLLFGGISQQPAHQRFPHQVEDARNAMFLIRDGINKRAGTTFIREFTEDAGANLRLHAISRDEFEQFLVVFGEGVLRVFELDGTESTVNVEASAQPYLDLNSATADQLRLVTIVDFTILVNTTVPVEDKTSDNFTVTEVFRDFATMISTTPAIDTFHRATGGEDAGFFKYVGADPAGEGTFATLQLDGVKGSFGNANGDYNDNGKNPSGFEVQFQRVAFTALDMTWTQATKKLAKVGVFASYTFRSGDAIRITDGTGTVTGFAPILAKDSDDQIELTVDIGVDAVDVDADSIGIEIQVEQSLVFTFPEGEDGMLDVAKRIEDSLQLASADTGLISWDQTGGNRGFFTITSPFNGADAKVFQTNPPDDGTLFDYTTNGKPFETGTGIATDGTGTQSAADVLIQNRWVSVAAPAQPGASLDNTTMPIKMVRTSPPPGAVFDVDLIDYADRTSGDEISNPTPSLWQDGTKISDISFHRNRLVFAGDENVVFSQAGDLFNFYLDDANNIVDSDPIDVQISTEEVTLIDFVVPFRKSLVIFTKAGIQFELNAPATLTQDTVDISLTTSYRSHPSRPEPMGNFIYFAGRQKEESSLYEYFFEDSRSSNSAANVTSHVPNFLPDNVRTVQTSQNDSTVCVIGVDDNKIFLYRFFFSGDRKEQSAWTIHEFDSNYRIADIAIIDNACWMLVEDTTGAGGRYFLENFCLNIQQEKTGWPYRIHLDRQVEIALGTFAAGPNETTWILPYLDNTVDAIVLGPDFTTPGTILTPTSVATVGGVTNVKAAGDQTAGEVTIGRKFNMKVELTRPFRRDRNGQAVIDARLTTRKIVTPHSNTGAYKIKSTLPLRADREVAFDVLPIDARGSVTAWHNGDAEEQVNTLENDSPKPSIINGVEYDTDFDPRRGVPS